MVVAWKLLVSNPSWAYGTACSWYLSF